MGDLSPGKSTNFSSVPEYTEYRKRCKQQRSVLIGLPVGSAHFGYGEVGGTQDVLDGIVLCLARFCFTCLNRLS